MKKRYVRLGVALLALTALVGCARRTAVPTAYPTTTNPGYTTTPNYNNTTPNYNTTNPYGNTNQYGNTNPYGNTGSTGNYYNTGTGYNTGYGATPYMGQARLTASVQKSENGTFLGIGKFTVTVMVNNPSQMSLSGQLQVNFTDSGKAVKTVTDRVQVGPGQSVTRTYEDPSWKVDAATVNVTTDSSVTDPLMGGTPNNGFGQTNPYGYM